MKKNKIEKLFFLSFLTFLLELVFGSVGFFFKSIKKSFFLNLFLRLQLLVATILMLFQTIMTYALMLIVMDFNFWLFLSLILGYTFGYFIFYSDLKINFLLLSNLISIYDKLYQAFA